MGGSLLRIGLVVGLLALLAGAAWMFGFADREKTIMGGTEEQALAVFTSECVADMMRWKALGYGNTSAQIDATCGCFGREIYPVFKQMTPTEGAAYTKSMEGRQRRQVIFQKCINKFGLDGADEWYPGAGLDER